jgi:hypothetical protein
VRALRKTAGEQISMEKPSGEYWERYEPRSSEEPLYLSYAYYQIPGDVVEDLMDMYTKSIDALDARTVTAFPGLAWRYPSIQGGAVVIDTDDGILKETGVAEGQVITAVQGREVKDVGAFDSVLQYQLTTLSQESGDLKLTVQSDSGTAEVSVPAHLFQVGGTIIE